MKPELSRRDGIKSMGVFAAAVGVGVANPLKTEVTKVNSTWLPPLKNH